MPFGLPWSEKFIGQITEKEDRDEFVADQVRLLIALSVRALREQRGMSQTEFGNLIGKPQSVVSRLEDPDYGRASVQTLLEIAAALDIPVSITFPQWEDWFRSIRKNKKADLERRNFNDVIQAGPAANDPNVLQFSAFPRERAISTTVTVDQNGISLKGWAHA